MLKANCCKKVIVVVLLVSIVSALAGAESFRFTVSCDNRPIDTGNIPLWEWLLDEMTDKAGDEGVFHIMPGDFDDPQYTDASLIRQFGEDVVWYPVVGNHEAETPADMEWIRDAYYSLPHIVKEGPAGCETTTYSWDYGNAHFVALNQYYNGVSDTGAGGDIVDELYDWLVADLEANTQPFVFIIGHEPAYPEYRHLGDSLDQHPAHRDRFWKLLNDKQVIAYFCGHTHYYYAKQVDGPDWEPFTWQVDAGNAGNPGEACQTFVDVTVTETEVIFNTWQGTQNSPFTNIESWTVGVPYKAYKPKPVDGAVCSATCATLFWEPGVYAVSHDVYMGDNFDDVNDGTAETFRGNHTFPFYTVGIPGFHYPEGLVPDTIYYWRVDEINDLDPNSPWKGNIWSFLVPPRTAYEPDPADGATFVDPNVVLNWAKGLGAIVQTVYFGDSFDDVNNASGGHRQGTATYTPGPLELEKFYYWRVDQSADGITTYKGDIWSFRTLPVISITDPDLIGWWTFDKGHGETAIDWSGHGNDGTLGGDPQWVDGILKGALDLTGDYVSIDAVADDITTNDITLSAWIRTTQAGEGNVFASNTGSSHVLLFGVANGNIYVDDGRSTNWPPAINDNQWHMITFVLSGTSIYLYTDGVQVASISTTIDITSETRWSIGQEWDSGPSDFYIGMVDDARFYKKALTAEEVMQIMRGER